MVKIKTEEIRRLMDLKHNIRNVTFVSHVHHGKSSLAKSLVDTADMITTEDAEDYILTDKKEHDMKRIRVTTKSTAISLYYTMSDESLKSYNGERTGNTYLINLINSPGHVDFSFEVTAALRITDGVVVVVDCIKGVRIQTENVLRQAFGERIKPVLALNKIDQCFKLQFDGEEAYQMFQRVIENANVVIATCTDTCLSDVQFDPVKGNVAFSAGLYGWAFTLTNFAKMYASQTGIEETKMMQRHWGENFFDPATKKWTSNNTDSPTCKRGFVQFCYEPIKQILDTCMNNQKDKLWRMLQKVGVTMMEDDMDLVRKPLMDRVMQSWHPAKDALLEMMIYHLPSPSTAQRYHTENLYQGPLDDMYSNTIRNCDPEGPLMIYISKMIQAADKSRLFAFGRVFSGTVSTGMKVKIMGPNYVLGQKQDLYVKCVQNTSISVGKKFESVKDVPSRNTVIIDGLGQFITKNATLTNGKDVVAHPIRAMKFSVSPVLRIAVESMVASDLPKLVEGLKHLAKTDPMVVCTVEESGQHVISTTGFLHLETCLTVITNFLDGADYRTSEPLVSIRE